MPSDTLTERINTVLTKYGGLISTSEEGFRLRSSLANLFQNENNVAAMLRQLSVLEEAVSSHLPHINLIVRDVSMGHKYITTRKVDIDRTAQQLKMIISAISKSASPSELTCVVGTLKTMKTTTDQSMRIEKNLQNALVQRLRDRVNDLTTFTQEVRDYPSKIAFIQAENEKIRIQLEHSDKARNLLEARIAERAKQMSALELDVIRKKKELGDTKTRIETLIDQQKSEDSQSAEIVSQRKLLDSEIDAIIAQVNATIAENEKKMLFDRSNAETELNAVLNAVEGKKTTINEVEKRLKQAKVHLAEAANEETVLHTKIEKETTEINAVVAKLTRQQEQYRTAQEAKDKLEQQQAEILEAERQKRQEQARLTAKAAEKERLRREEEAKIAAEKDKRLAEFEAKAAAELERKQKYREKRLQRKREKEESTKYTKNDTMADCHSDTDSVGINRDLKANVLPEEEEVSKEDQVKEASADPQPLIVESDDHDDDNEEEEEEEEDSSSTDSDDSYVPSPEKQDLKKKKAVEAKQKRLSQVDRKKAANSTPKKDRRKSEQHRAENNANMVTPEDKRKAKLSVTPKSGRKADFYEDSTKKQSVTPKLKMDSAQPTQVTQKVDTVVHTELSDDLFNTGINNSDGEEARLKEIKTPVKHEAPTKRLDDFKEPHRKSHGHNEVLIRKEPAVVKERYKPRADFREAELLRKQKLMNLVPKEDVIEASQKSKQHVDNSSEPSRRPKRASTRTAQRNIHDQLKQLQVQFSDDEDDKIPRPSPKPTPINKVSYIRPPVLKKPIKHIPINPIQPSQAEAEISFWDC